MSTLDVNRIKAKLTADFNGKIDLSDVADRPEPDVTAVFLSRALAAFALQIAANVEVDVAAGSVIDGFNDNGLDAVYYDPATKQCFLVQSKFIQDGNGSIAAGDIEKTLRGIDDLLNGDFSHFNEKIHPHLPDLQAALDDIEARFVLLLVYTGSQGLSDDVKRRIESTQERYNDVESDQLELTVLDQGKINRAVLEMSAGPGINFEMMLHEWGQVQEPYQAFYGLVDLADIQTQWAQYGQRLTAKNLRHFVGSTAVNDGIAGTLRNSPEEFFYLNNGLTIVCESVHKKPLGGASRDSGIFVLEGASIVNGAQTVGTVLQAPAVAPAGQAFVKIISLASGPNEFGRRVTEAANTQNRIERKDFAALDPVQQRLSTDVSLEVDKRYAYKTGEIAPAEADGCTIDDAAVALACSAGNVVIAVQAKREAGSLYDQPTYGQLFSPQLSGRKLWRSVLIMRAVESTLRQSRLHLNGRDRLISVHGNRFVLFMVFSKLESWDTMNDEDSQALLATVQDVTERVLGDLITVVEASYPGYPASLFKNATKCTEIERSLRA